MAYFIIFCCLRYFLYNQRSFEIEST